MTARYRLLAPEDVAALTPRERERYAAERAAFDAEVAQHKAHGREHGWIDVGTAGKVVRFELRGAPVIAVVKFIRWLFGLHAAQVAP